MDPQNHDGIDLTDCPRCDGTGFVTGDGPPDDDEKKCLVCHGMGELDVDVAQYINDVHAVIRGFESRLRRIIDIAKF